MTTSARGDLPFAGSLFPSALGAVIGDTGMNSTALSQGFFALGNTAPLPIQE